MYSDAYVDPDTKKIYRTQVVNADVCGLNFAHSFFFCFFSSVFVCFMSDHDVYFNLSFHTIELRITTGRLCEIYDFKSINLD